MDDDGSSHDGGLATTPLDVVVRTRRLRLYQHGGAAGRPRRAGATPAPPSARERLARKTVVKRDGREEPVNYDKIAAHITKLCYGLHLLVDPHEVVTKVIPGLVDRMATADIDRLAAEKAAGMCMVHPDYGTLAARLLITRLHVETTKSFSALVIKLAKHVNPNTGKLAPCVSEELVEMVRLHGDRLDQAIVHNRDMNFHVFGLLTLMRSYLLRDSQGNIAETPQNMYMRVACGVWGADHVEEALQTYEHLSTGDFTFASPTLFHAGTPHPTLASCFLLSLTGNRDSIESIFDTLKRCALISKGGGGIGIHMHNVRAQGSYIEGTGGTSNGLVPLLRVYNNTARYVDQGGNKRPGAFAVYLEPWHADLLDWLELKYQEGPEELRARDLFLGLWVPDLFMRRAQENGGGTWSLFCPHQCPGLSDVWGQKFEDLYTRYEREGRARKTLNALELLKKIAEVQLRTGSPYMCFKDHANRTSNQQNLGTIQSSNLCVSGDTRVLTEYGQLAIRDLARPRRALSDQDRRNVKDYMRTSQEMADVAAQVAQAEKAAAEASGSERDAGASSRLKLLRERRNVLQATLDSLEEVARLAAELERDGEAKVEGTARPVRVWNGVGWVKVVCKRTSAPDAKVPLMLVGTSHGARLWCTPEHQFILADGRRAAARDLRLGDRLAASPPEVYPGRELQALSDDSAFRRGYVFGYALQKMSEGKHEFEQRENEVSVPVMVVRKAVVTLETLQLLGYDEAKARAHEELKKQDHDTLAFIQVPKGEHNMQTREQGPVPTRRHWVRGFLTALEGQLTNARGGRAVMERAWRMLRSVGQDVALVPHDRKGEWRLQPTALEARRAAARRARMAADAAPGDAALAAAAERLEADAAPVDSNCVARLLRASAAEARDAATAHNWEDFVAGAWRLDDCPVVSQLLDAAHAGVAEETYCFTEPELHAGVFGGQLTGQCSEIIQYSAPDETATCNLSSICLPRFVTWKKTLDGKYEGRIDHARLHKVAQHLTLAMNRVIDRMEYIDESTRRSNLRHRPIGIGVQGLADVFALLRLPFDSPDARAINRALFETIHHGCLTASCALAQREGFYETFPGSPASEGRLQVDLWPNDPGPSERWDWAQLRRDVKQHGLRNSLLTTVMPTASTAQILGNNECIEPFTTNMYTRNVLSGEFQVVNRHMVADLDELGMWTEEVRQSIKANRGSVQHLQPDSERYPAATPEHLRKLKEIYRTVWEIPHKSLVDMAADRAVFVDQSQSLNAHLRNPTVAQICSMHVYAWKKGLPTGMYYLRTNAATEAVDVRPAAASSSKAATQAQTAAAEAESSGVDAAGGGGAAFHAPPFRDMLRRDEAAAAAVSSHAAAASSEAAAATSEAADAAASDTTAAASDAVAAVVPSVLDFLACSLDNPEACKMCSG